MFATFAGKLPSLLKSKNDRAELGLFTQEVFSTVYGFKTGPGGLAYLGLGIGFFSAGFFGAKTADKVYKYVSSLSQLSPFPMLTLPLILNVISPGCDNLIMTCGDEYS